MQNTGSTKRLYAAVAGCAVVVYLGALWNGFAVDDVPIDRKSTRLNSSHSQISYAVFCLKKKSEQTRESAPAPLSFPDNPNLDWLRKQAKQHLEELRKTNSNAQLADAQFDLAKRYGFSSW